MEIIIATSIAPRKIELQQGAIASWRKCGFDVISVNSKDEIHLLNDFFPEVKFVEVSRNASKIAGKPFVYFDDVLQALEATGSPICGIVNSDIYLTANWNIKGFIEKEARDSIIFGSRIDINSLDSLKGEESNRGFDYFFFSHAIIKSYIQTDFCMGAPWWDYWAPLVPIVKGFPVKQMITPFAYHIKHPITWEGKPMIDFGNKFLAYLMQDELMKSMERDLLDIIEENKEQLDNFQFVMRIWGYLNRKSLKIMHLDPLKGNSGESVSSHECQKMKAELEYYIKRQKQYEDILIDQLRNMKKDFHTSLSWRITAPFRWLYNKISGMNG